MPVFTLDDLKKSKTNDQTRSEESATAKKLDSKSEKDGDSDNNDLNSETIRRDGYLFEPGPESENSDGGSEAESASKRSRKSKAVKSGKPKSKKSVAEAEINIQGDGALSIRELRKRRFESTYSQNPGESDVQVEGEGSGEMREAERVKYDENSAKTGLTGRTRLGRAYNWDGKYGEGQKLG